MPISARNKLRGKIEEIQLGDIMAHVVVRVGDNLIESAITRRSADELKLKKGDVVTAVVKATEVMIQKDRPASLNVQHLQDSDLPDPAGHPLFVWYDDPVRPLAVIQRFPIPQEGQHHRFVTECRVHLR
jgi:molybdopterin-binding protein